MSNRYEFEPVPDKFPGEGFSSFNQMKSLRKAKSMSVKGMYWDGQKFSMESGLSSTHQQQVGQGNNDTLGGFGSMNELRNGADQGFYPIDATESPGQVQQLKFQERSLRSAASTSHLLGRNLLAPLKAATPNSHHMNQNYPSMNDVLSSVDNLSIGSHAASLDPGFDSLLEPSQGRLVRDMNRLKPMFRTQSMRAPPGFERFRDSDNVNPETLQEFKMFSNSLSQQEPKQLKRFVTFAGNLKTSKESNKSCFVPLSKPSSIADDFSDDEDVDVSVIEDERLMELPGLMTTPSPGQNMGSSGLRKEHTKLPDNVEPEAGSRNLPPASTMKRIDSARMMRKAFPKTMFDNVDTHDGNGISNPVVKRINSKASMKSVVSLASTSTNTSHTLSPHRQRKEKKNFVKPAEFEQAHAPPPPGWTSPMEATPAGFQAPREMHLHPQATGENTLLPDAYSPCASPGLPLLNTQLGMQDPAMGYYPPSPSMNMSPGQYGGASPTFNQEQLLNYQNMQYEGAPYMRNVNMPADRMSPSSFPMGAGQPGTTPLAGFPNAVLSAQQAGANLSTEQAQLLQQSLQNQMLVNMMLQQQNALQRNLMHSLSPGSTPRTSPPNSSFMYPNNVQRRPRNGNFPAMQRGAPAGKNKQGYEASFGDKNISNLLIRHKTTGYRPGLQELLGHVEEFSRDSHGSRLVQCLMETASPEEKELLINEVLPDAVSLMQDLFGNYVLQNFLEHCNDSQRMHLASQIKKSMSVLSFQPHGCRVVQRAIDILSSRYRNDLLNEILQPTEKITRCAKDPHATHVLQKAVILLQKETKKSRRDLATGKELSAEERSQHEENEALLKCIECAVEASVLQLAVHPHACRLVQKTLGDCIPERSARVSTMLDTIGKVFPMLSVEQHGNFILQHILDNGSLDQKNEVQDFVCGKFLELAQHKFGSHLVEKCLQSANPEQAQKLVKELLAPALALRKERGDSATGYGEKDENGDVLMALMKDPYANFVVQRAFDASRGELRAQIVREVQDRAEILSRFTYGRHILSHVNRSDS